MRYYYYFIKIKKKHRTISLDQKITLRISILDLHPEDFNKHLQEKHGKSFAWMNAKI